ncbi:MAG: hypothetical protein IPL61_19180 [Myxococcales bacterium]|nr:hypothetical protein [Myxococcales bacterium]
MSAVLACAAPAPAAAQPVPPPAVADLDGLQLWVGPAGAATRIDGSWESTWGGGVQLVRVRERAAVAVAGAGIGAAHYAGSDGGRLWLDAVIGTRRLGGVMLGLAAGPAVDLGGDHHPRPGGTVAIWAFAGVTPVVRVGALEEAGVFVEVGASLALPALRW